MLGTCASPDHQNEEGVAPTNVSAAAWHAERVQEAAVALGVLFGGGAAGGSLRRI
jgi:hypothetical protein